MCRNRSIPFRITVEKNLSSFFPLVIAEYRTAWCYASTAKSTDTLNQYQTKRLFLTSKASSFFPIKIHSWRMRTCQLDETWLNLASAETGRGHGKGEGAIALRNSGHKVYALFVIYRFGNSSARTRVHTEHQKVTCAENHTWKSPEWKIETKPVCRPQKSQLTPT